MVNEINKLAQRLLSVQWSDYPRYRRSQALLMQEYLRRSAWWWKELDGPRWPFFDIAAGVDPTIRADHHVVRRVQDSLIPTAGHAVNDSCINALHFAALRDTQVQLPDLPDPFLPLILIIERGSIFGTDRVKFMEVDGLAFRYGTVLDNLGDTPLAPMDIAQLDAIDLSA